MKAADFHEEAPEFLFSRLSNGRNVVVDAPPGIGKTRAAAKVGIRLVKQANKKVLIIEPTKTLRAQVCRFIKEEDPEIPVYESKALSDYHCSKIDTFADPQLCAVSKDQCKGENRGCAVLEDMDKLSTSSLTVATFAKFLLAKSYFRNHDTILIDESHGFENAETSFLQTYLLIRKIEETANDISADYSEEAGKLRTLANGLVRINELVGDSVPLEAREVESVREAIGDERFRWVSIECSRSGKHPYYRTLYQNMSSLHFRMQSINDNIFFFHEGALYGRPKNMITEVASFFRDRNIGLLSATVDDAVLHARECGLDLRRLNEKDALLLTEYPAVRRKNRKLLAITDGPSLSKSNESYEDVRDVANRILLNILEKFKVKTLVLFRSYADHKSSAQFLGDSKIGDRIINIEQAEEPDAIDDKLHQLKTKNVVLASASSRLWEGVDIPGLRLVVIDALPYPGKDPLDKEYNFRKGYIAMIKKLRQGLGRIVRSDDDWGAAIVIDNRFIQRFQSISQKLPWHMGEDFEKVPFSKAMEELEGFIRSRS
jgi:hypothetical protein